MQNIDHSVFIHSHAIVEEGARIGARTRVWAFAHILPGAVIGEDCNLCDQTYIENDVKIGNRVTLKNGVYVPDGIRLADDVFVGPNAVFNDDRFPQSKQHPDSSARTYVDQGASIEANASISPGIRIGTNAMVRAGAVATQDIPPNAIVVGNPARIVAYVDTLSHESLAASSEISETTSQVRGVAVLELNHVADLRGDLCVAEWKTDIPFEPKRVFYVYNVPNVRVRGEHAHKECHQYLVCVHGSVSVVVDDGQNREEYRLDRPWIGLHIPPHVWSIQYKYSSDGVLMVFASHKYNPDDYIRDYNEFLQATKGTTPEIRR